MNNFATFSADWSVYVAPAVIAAVVSGAISIVGFTMNTITMKNIHREKIIADKELARERFDYDMQLAEKRFEFDTALSERKILLDIGAKTHQVRQSLAEELLAGFHEAEVAVRGIRSRIVYKGEGASRPKEAAEDPDETERLNSRFVIIERFERSREMIARLNSKEHRAVAWLGPEARKPFDDLNTAIRDLLAANEMLVEDERNQTGQVSSESVKNRQMVYGAPDGDDPVSKQLLSAITHIDALCIPILRQPRDGELH